MAKQPPPSDARDNEMPPPPPPRTPPAQHRGKLSTGTLLSFIGIVVAVATGLASLALTWSGLRISKDAMNMSQDSATKVDASRVEMGVEATNTNDPDPANIWTAWVEPNPGVITYVGVERRIFFSKPFLNTPNVRAAFSVVEVPPLDLVMTEAGYPVKDPKEGRRLRDVHVVTWTGYLNSRSFILYVGIGLPKPCGDYLVRHLKTMPVDKEALDSEVYLHYLGAARQASGNLSDQEKWMMNFYTAVGSFDVTWVATADQK